MSTSPTTHTDTTRTDFLEVGVLRKLLLLNIVMAAAYTGVLAFWLPQGNPVLFALLMAGQFFYLFQTIGYAYTVWRTDYEAEPISRSGFTESVDVVITVAGEPAEVVEQTVLAVTQLDYPSFTVTILNDGYVTKKDNWQEIEQLAKQLKVGCITRRIPGGAKAGNINHGLNQLTSSYVAVFDADHAPHPDFLAKTMPYFHDAKMAFVQSPQYYKNHGLNVVTSGAWGQQELFFGPICRGKNRLNATFMCGTNMVVRRTALAEAGGMNETNIAEDFLTSLLIHEKGWKSVYVPEVLAEGLAPEDFQSYDKQQHRWARGSLEIMFKYNPLFRRGLSLPQRLQYLISASYFLSGAVTVMYALLPIIFFLTGAVPLNVSTMVLVAFFLPYIFLTIYVLQISSKAAYSFRALAFSLSSYWIHLRALWAVLTGQRTTFSVTSKRRLSGNFVRLVLPHLVYVGLVVIGVTVALLRDGLNASVVNNLSWALLYIAIFAPFIAAALPSRQKGPEIGVTDPPMVVATDEVTKQSLGRTGR